VADNRIAAFVLCDALGVTMSVDRSESKSQNLAVFSQAMTEDQWQIVLYYYISVARFVWRLGEMPLNGIIVVVAHGSQPVRWLYLPDGAARLDVESGFVKSYQWYESADCQAIIMKDMKIIDRWRFTVLP
jgi:hypothetical protein